MHNTDLISIFPELGRSLNHSDVGKQMVAVRPCVDLESRLILSDLIPTSIHRAEAEAFVYINQIEIFHNGRVQRLTRTQISAPVYMLLTDFLKVAETAKMVIFNKTKAMGSVDRIVIRVVYPTLGKSYTEYKDGERLVRTYPIYGGGYDHIPDGTLQDPFLVSRLKIENGKYSLTVPYFNSPFPVEEDCKYLSVQEFNNVAISAPKEEHVLAKGQLVQIKKLSS